MDVDLEKFFDRVNHDVLMGKLAKRIRDRRVLGLIRRYLEAGVMAEGVVMARPEGTPQGGPLSPLLANVLLDEVDKELEKRGIRRITRRTGGRSMTRVIEELREYLPGWSNYFSLAETPTPLADLDKWIRHRLRSLYLKLWKRGPTAYRRLRAFGAHPHVAAAVAANIRRRWKISRHAFNAALPNSHFDALGLPRLGV